MGEKFPQEVGLLRKITANLQRTLIPVDPSVEAYFREHGLPVPNTPPSWKTDTRNILKHAADRDSAISSLKTSTKEHLHE